MIRDLYAIVDKPAQRMLTMLLIASALAAAAQGIAFVGLFPFLTSFISGDDAVSRWLVLILITTIIHAALVLFTGFIGRASSAAILRSLLSMLGERISRLPLSYFRQGVDGSLADMASSGIGFAAAVPHVVVRPVITDTVHALRADHTVIVVAHQLNTIRDADHIVVLNEAGQVVEQGTHDELMKLGGQYHHHWQIRTTS